LISALVFLAVYRARPDLITETASAGQPQRLGELVRYGLLVTLGVAVFVAPFACSWPDGLDSVAEKFGFSHKMAAPLLPAPAPDYQVPGIHWRLAQRRGRRSRFTDCIHAGVAHGAMAGAQPKDL